MNSRYICALNSSRSQPKRNSSQRRLEPTKPSSPHRRPPTPVTITPKQNPRVSRIAVAGADPWSSKQPRAAAFARLALHRFNGNHRTSRPPLLRINGLVEPH
ncbi:unnamed protein product [Bursaphelenchus okinawaensis]|uniref:Uncharacterized protein n=1 Tax=Bursaphelenchus okinawaensis TaxID=465554 RepID=A0A811K1Y6_9BILA|nr:unnamed protein product [Bursaphelenchus okinawaensis]CAG9088687.1 unnamed protein product [Bursaphelenchus okinawaensis]